MHERGAVFTLSQFLVSMSRTSSVEDRRGIRPSYNHSALLALGELRFRRLEQFRLSLKIVGRVSAIALATRIIAS